ncbi:MAG TPA: SDR family oxidoreductase [Stellaceae bacterium]|nr:SDR family oxidoreductase [Stellaceae bacterium]
MTGERLSILVTGGAGYIGSTLVPTLLEAGHAVTVLDNFMYEQNSLAAYCADPRFAVVRGDARQEAALRPLVAKADVVIPLAALVGAPACDRDPIGATSTNRDAIALLAGLLGAGQRLLYPNTNSGYGIGERDKQCTEDAPLRPISLYGRDKVEAERIVLERENALSFRFATVFGMAPRMRLDLLVNDFVHRALTDRSIMLFEGHFKRNYIHVRDVARAFQHGVENFAAMRGRPFNVGLSDANLSKVELCERIKRFLPDLVYVEAPIGRDPDKRDYIVSNARIEATGFAPRHSLDDGIAELIRGLPMLGKGAYRNA